MRISLFALSLLPVLASAAGTWDFVPVEGGAVRDLVVQPDRLIAATDDGIYTSDDAGDHWERHGDLPRWTKVGIVRVDTNQPDHWFAFIKPNGKAYAFGYFALAESVDDGLTWVTVWEPSHTEWGRAASLTLHPLSPGLVLFSSRDLELLTMRSLDGGATWSNVAPNDSPALVLLDAPGHFVTAPSNESTDGGASWHHANLALPALTSWGVVRLESDPNDGGAYFFADYDPDFARTPPMQSTAFGRIDLSSGTLQSYSDSCLCTHTQVLADPHWAGRLLSGAFFAGDYYGTGVNGLRIRESLDNGSTWHALTRIGVGGNDLLRADPNVANRFFIPTLTRLLRSDDGGASFEPKVTGLAMAKVNGLSVDPRNPLSFVVARAGLPVQYTNDGGQSFKDPDLAERPASLELLVRATDNPDRLLATDPFGIFRSDDGGRTWQHIDSVMPAGFGPRIYRLLSLGGNGERFVASVEGGLIWSADGGETWTGATGISAFATPYTARANPNKIYAQTNDGAAYVSEGFGSSFEPLPSTDSFDLNLGLYVHPYDDSILLAYRRNGTSTYTTWRSEDSGVSWAEISDAAILNPPDLLLDACDDRTVWARGGMLSRDGGRTFQYENSLSSWGDLPENLCIGGLSYNYSLGPQDSALQVRRPEVGDTLFREGFEG